MIPPLSSILSSYSSGAYLVSNQVGSLPPLGNEMDQIGRAIDFVNYEWLRQHNKKRANDLKNVFVPNLKIDLSNVTVKELYEWTYYGDKYFGISEGLMSTKTKEVESTEALVIRMQGWEKEPLEALLLKWQKESKPQYAALRYSLCKQLQDLYQSRIKYLEGVAADELQKFSSYTAAQITDKGI